MALASKQFAISSVCAHLKQNPGVFNTTPHQIASIVTIITVHHFH